jgi:hypothetical protein
MLDYITTSTIDPMPEVFTLLDSVSTSYFMSITEALFTGEKFRQIGYETVG